LRGLLGGKSESAMKLFVLRKGFDAVDAEQVVGPLDSLGMQSGDDAVSVTGGK
jgi:hypothetical protein